MAIADRMPKNCRPLTPLIATNFKSSAFLSSPTAYLSTISSKYSFLENSVSTVVGSLFTVAGNYSCQLAVFKQDNFIHRKLYNCVNNAFVNNQCFLKCFR